MKNSWWKAFNKKIPRYAEKKGNIAHNWEKKISQSRLTPEMIQMLEWVDKDIKTIIITLVHVFKKLEKIWKQDIEHIF